MVTQNHGEFVYVGEAIVNGTRISLSEAEAHHLTRVRRARVGERVMATDGKGSVYLCNLIATQTLEILETFSEFGEPEIQITLICGCLQGDTSRDVVSSAVQLGARRLWWVKLARSQESYSANKIEKLERVAIQSMKQTGRARQIEQQQFKSLQEALTQLTNTNLWVAHPDNHTGIVFPEVEKSGSHSVLVGPEGGFDERELDILKSLNARFLRLGSRRLRSEAAAAASLMFLLTRSGDL